MWIEVADFGKIHIDLLIDNLFVEGDVAMQKLYRVAAVFLIAVPQVTWAQEKSPHSPTALGILAQARQLSDSLPGLERDRVLAKIAVAQARAGDLEAALTSVKEIDFVPYRQGAIVDIATVHVQKGEGVAASKILDQFVEELIHGDSEHIVTSLRDIATAQVKFGDVLAAKETCRRALRIIDEIKIPQSRDVALRDIAVVQALTKDADAAQLTAQKIAQKLRQNEALSLVADCQAEALGDWQQALETVNSIDDESVIFPLIRIASAQAKSGKMQEAEDTVEMIKTKVEKPQYASRIVDSASMAIAVAQFERGDHKGALDRLNSVSDPRLKSRAMVSIAEFQEKKGDLKGALQTLRSVVQDGSNSSIIARLQAKIGDTKGAMQTAETIEDSFRKAWAYIYIAKSQTTMGNYASAVTSLEQACQSAESVNNRNKDTVMRNIATAYGRAGKYTAALKTSQTIENESDKSLALFEIARDRSRAGDLVGALSAANAMSSAIEKSYSLVGVAEGL